MGRVVFSLGDFDITWREIAISVIIFFLLLTLGMFISSKIEDGFSDQGARQATALQIENNTDIFNHTIDTKLGDIIAYGPFFTKDPVSLKEIDGQYLYIEKIEERYVQKTRIVTYSCNCTENGCDTCTKTETYWEWDEVERWEYWATQVNFMGRDFPCNKFRGYSDYHLTTIKTSSRVRFQYDVVPDKFNATIKANTASGDLRDWDDRSTITLHQNMTIEQVIKSTSFWNGFILVLFWLLWLGIMGFAIYGYVYLENEYLY